MSAGPETTMQEPISMSQPDLFGDTDPQPATAPEVNLSAGHRITARQRADVEHGVHPLVGGLILTDGRTCGDCAHRIHNDHGYPKCDRTTMARSQSSDCRAWWPACAGFEPVT